MNADMKRLEDKFDHAILLARQSTPESLSPLLQEIRNKIDTHGEKLDKHIQTHEDDVKDIKNDISVLKESVEPAVDAVETAKGLRRGVIWLAGFILATGTVWMALGKFKEWIKN